MGSPARSGRHSSSRRLRLDNVGGVRGGYVAPKATANQARTHDLRALQAADVAADGSIEWESLRFVPAVTNGSRYGIGEGDVLLPLRSARTPAVVARRVPPSVIAVGHWAIVSPDPARADSEFLAWYLNHPVTAARLAGLMRGTKLQFLSLTDLRAFEIELPPLEMQRCIARVHSLNERIARLEQELTQARKQYVDAVTMEAVQGHPESPHE